MEKNKKNNLIEMILIVLALILFIVNTIFVLTGKCSSIDENVHDFIRLFASDSMDKIMKIFTFLGCTTFMIILALFLLIYFLVKKEKINALMSVGGLIVSTILNNIVKFIIRRPRPEYITVVEKTFSYPSGHTMASTTIYGLLIYIISKSNINKSVKIVSNIILSLLILLVPISRIYLGAHYFTDVYGAALLSLIIILIIILINSNRKNRKKDKK